MRKDNESRKCRSGCNPDRTCYLSSDGKYYCYEIWDSDTGRMVTLKYEVGRDGLTVELARFLDQSDHDADLIDRCEEELRDLRFAARAASYEADPDDEDAIDPWDTLPDKGGSPEEVLFAADEPENPDVVRVRRVIDEECTEAQRDFVFAYFGCGMQLEELCRTEAERTGRLPSPAAMINCRNRILDKVAKSLGVERVKRRESSG